MAFPYERYETLAEPLTFYYPTGQEAQARQIFEAIDRGSKLLAQMLEQPVPEMEILLAAPSDWQYAPQEDTEEPNGMLPYLADVTVPPTLVIPSQLDPVIGTTSPEKLAFLLFHQVTYAFLEKDPRPWPGDSPLWADEWQLQFASLWLCQQLYSVTGIVMKDLHEQMADIFEPELDGKTPVTIRGFDWYEDTTPEEYLEYTLLLERFAADLLATYDISILPRFLEAYRKDVPLLLSDEVTEMLAATLGDDGAEWLEELVYF